MGWTRKGVSHDVGEDGAGGADEGADGGEDRLVEHETLNRKQEQAVSKK